MQRLLKLSKLTDLGRVSKDLLVGKSFDDNITYAMTLCSSDEHVGTTSMTQEIVYLDFPLIPNNGYYHRMHQYYIPSSSIEYPRVYIYLLTCVREPVTIEALNESYLKLVEHDTPLEIIKPFMIYLKLINKGMPPSLFQEHKNLEKLLKIPRKDRVIEKYLKIVNI